MKLAVAGRVLKAFPMVVCAGNKSVSSSQLKMLETSNSGGF